MSTASDASAWWSVISHLPGFVDSAKGTNLHRCKDNLDRHIILKSAGPINNPAPFDMQSHETGLTMLNREVLEKVVAKAKELATHSWEHVILAEALLQLEDRDSSIFFKENFPVDKFPWAKMQGAEGLRRVRQYIRSDGLENLCKDNTDVADPTSLDVVARILANITRNI